MFNIILINEPYNFVIRKDKRTFIQDIKRIKLYTIPSRRILKSGFSLTGNNFSGISKIFKNKNIKRTKLIQLIYKNI